MRTLILLMLFSTGFSSLIHAQAKIEAEKADLKFPALNAGQSLHFSFPIKNIGNEALLIQNAQVSCTCTRVLFPLKPIKPGTSDSVHVYFDSTGKKGFQARSIQLYSNAINNPFEFRFKVFVRRKND